MNEKMLDNCWFLCFSTKLILLFLLKESTAWGKGTGRGGGRKNRGEEGNREKRGEGRKEGNKERRGGGRKGTERRGKGKSWQRPRNQLL